MAGVFISYRRSVSRDLARLLFNELRRECGHDVFLDVNTIDNGVLDRIILNQIAARPHFVLILSRGSLERCVNEGDWLRREIEEAFRLQRNIVPIYDEGFNIDHEKQFLPESVREKLAIQSGLPYSHYFFDAFMQRLCNGFLRESIADIKIITPAALERAEAQRRIDQAAGTTTSPKPTPAPTRSKVYDILPAPFEWIDIPAGKVTVMNKTDTLPAFKISKYPVTNAQYEVFVKQGYTDQKWWNFSRYAEVWRKKNSNPKPMTFAGDNLPRSNINWFDAVAFCRWLSDLSGEKIMLPTEQQWQRTAQGDDGRIFPWGNEWDGNRCNNSIEPFDSNSTTPVTQYAGQDKGDSPFGVVDMVGNVWEWCLTSYRNGRHTIIGADGRVLKGGSWDDDAAYAFYINLRNGNSPEFCDDLTGFRFVSSNIL